MKSSFQVQIVLVSSVRVLGEENKRKRGEKRTKENICSCWECAMFLPLCISSKKARDY